MAPHPARLERIKQEFQYDPLTGLLTRKSRGSVKVIKGKNGHGYIVANMSGSVYYGHHIAWFLYHGRWPKEIDHINFRRADNRIENLREATRSNNRMNTLPLTASGQKGVYLHKETGKWVVHVRRNGVTKHVGLFVTMKEAITARDKYLETLGELEWQPQQTALTR